MRTTCSKSLTRMSQSSQLILNQSCLDQETSKLTRIQNICIIMNYRLVSTFGSGSCVSSFGSSPKVETAAVSSFGLTQKWKLRTRFQFWAVSAFGPAQRSLMEKIKALLGNVLEKETYERLNGLKTRTSVH